jgi:hypothetical protein
MKQFPLWLVEMRRRPASLSEEPLSPPILLSSYMRKVCMIKIISMIGGSIVRLQPLKKHNCIGR